MTSPWALSSPDGTSLVPSAAHSMRAPDPSQLFCPFFEQTPAPQCLPLSLGSKSPCPTILICFGAGQNQGWKWKQKTLWDSKAHPHLGTHFSFSAGAGLLWLQAGCFQQDVQHGLQCPADTARVGRWRALTTCRKVSHITLWFPSSCKTLHRNLIISFGTLTCLNQLRGTSLLRTAVQFLNKSGPINLPRISNNQEFFSLWLKVFVPQSHGGSPTHPSLSTIRAAHGAITPLKVGWQEWHRAENQSARLRSLKGKEKGEISVPSMWLSGRYSIARALRNRFIRHVPACGNKSPADQYRWPPQSAVTYLCWQLKIETLSVTWGKACAQDLPARCFCFSFIENTWKECVFFPFPVFIFLFTNQLPLFVSTSMTFKLHSVSPILRG